MALHPLQDQSASYTRARPEVRPGYTVRVHERIKEGNKERIQMFEGLVIAVHKGAFPTDTTFTVRRIASGVGVERVFSLHSPMVEKIDVKKVAKVRRAKLFFLRGRRGKAARLSERFTTAEEFAVAAAVASDPEQEEKMTDGEDAPEKEEESAATNEESVADTEATNGEKAQEDAPAEESEEKKEA